MRSIREVNETIREQWRTPLRNRVGDRPASRFKHPRRGHHRQHDTPTWSQSSHLEPSRFLIGVNRPLTFITASYSPDADRRRGLYGNLWHAGLRRGRNREDGERSHPSRRHRPSGIDCFCAGASPARRTSGLRRWCGDDRIGWRLTSAVPNDPGFEVRFDATRREPAGGNAPPEHGVIDTGGSEERCGCDGASAAHAIGFAGSGPNPKYILPHPRHHPPMVRRWCPVNSQREPLRGPRPVRSLAAFEPSLHFVDVVHALVSGQSGP